MTAGGRLISSARRQHRYLGDRSGSRRRQDPRHLRSGWRIRPGLVSGREAPRVQFEQNRAFTTCSAARQMEAAATSWWLNGNGWHARSELVAEQQVHHLQLRQDLWIQSLEGAQKPSVFVQTPFDETAPRSRPTGVGSSTAPTARAARKSTSGPSHRKSPSTRSRAMEGGFHAGGVTTKSFSWRWTAC